MQSGMGMHCWQTVLHSLMNSTLLTSTCPLNVNVLAC